MLKVKKEYLSELNIKVLDFSKVSYEETEEYLIFNKESESDILNTQNAGQLFSGFFKYPTAELILFFLKNQKLIIEEFKDWADGQGEGLLEMISNFNNMKNFSISEIGEALFTKLTEKELREFNMDLINYQDPLNEIREGFSVAVIEDFLLFKLENNQKKDEETE